MALFYLGVLGIEYATAIAGLIYGLEHLPTPGKAGDDANPDQEPDSGVAPDDDSPNNPDGGIIPGTEVKFHIHHAGPHNTEQSLTYLEWRRQWSLISRAWRRTWRHIPYMSVATIIGVFRGYHIYLSVREAVSLRRANRAMLAHRDIPPDTPMSVRRMIFQASLGMNEQFHRGVKRALGHDPFGSPPPRARR